MKNITPTPKNNMRLIKFKEFNPILIKIDRKILSDLYYKCQPKGVNINLENQQFDILNNL